MIETDQKIKNEKPEKELSGNKINIINVINYLVLKQNSIFILIVLVVISSIVSDVFFTEKNIFNLLRQVVPNCVISMGMLFVIITGGIDLSVGSIMALGSVLAALFLNKFGAPLGLTMTMGIGVIFGLTTGFLVAYTNIAPFVASLAMMTVGTGLAFIFSNGHPIAIPFGTIDEFGAGYILHIPKLVVLAIVIAIIMFLIQKYTAYGRIIIGIGSNENAVRLSGIKVKKYKLSVYAISGLMASIAGIVAVSRTAVGTPLIGSGMELDAIAAVVIGGASLAGGKGSVGNTVIGVIVLGLIGNIMNLMSVPAYPQEVIKGVIIIGAVLMQRVRND